MSKLPPATVLPPAVEPSVRDAKDAAPPAQPTPPTPVTAPATTLAGQLAEQQRQQRDYDADWKKRAEAFYVELLVRADAPQEGDVRALEDLMQELKISHELFAQHVQMALEAKRLSTVAAALPAVDDRRVQTREARVATEKRHKAEMEEAYKVERRASSEYSEAHRAIDDLAALARRYPQFFAPADATDPVGARYANHAGRMVLRTAGIAAGV